jgi:polyhydroxybutyrate depolymerase
MSRVELPEWTEQVAIRHEGRQRSYLLHVPPDLPDPAPLVLEIHGRGIDPLRFDRMTGFMAHADAHGFVVALPAAIDEFWDDGRNGVSDRPDDIAFIEAVLDNLPARVHVDEAATYAVGMSNGASMIGRIMCLPEASLAHRFAAAAQVAGTVLTSLLPPGGLPVSLPLLQIHGTSDPYWPYEGGLPRGVRERLLVHRTPAAAVGVDDWAATIARSIGTGYTAPETTAVSSDTSLRRWKGPSGGLDADFYRVEGGGHTWPGARIALPGFVFGRTTRSFDATAEIWSFFSRHRLPSSQNSRRMAIARREPLERGAPADRE